MKQMKEETRERLLTMTHAQYCKSKHWKRVCEHVNERDKGRCVLCNRTAIQYHHRAYAWKGIFEKEVDDVVSLCKRCHYTFHKNSVIESGPSGGYTLAMMTEHKDGSFSLINHFTWNRELE